MRDIKNKFVVVDNKIIGRRVVFHKDIHKSPIGGGWWYFHREQNKLILYGNSSDFGPVKKEDIDKAELCGSFRQLKSAELIFDKRDHVHVMSILCDHLGESEAARIVMDCDWI
jgi:hypothetical protein